MNQFKEHCAILIVLLLVAISIVVILAFGLSQQEFQRDPYPKVARKVFTPGVDSATQYAEADSIPCLPSPNMIGTCRSPDHSITCNHWVEIKGNQLCDAWRLMPKELLK